ncbi:LysR substrate-binding domain-containing protein [Flavisphingomonas formosensis]|uniref:LysR substrate-binding domain-containing protein n=1 Tax=Flavisphingomonas formosensis TaxID=861534 RepID=UPI0012FCD9DA|nr:LysR substrate-binding domain-containing protein [Sphingomonas formosensis]
MELRHLRYFVAVAEECNFRRASAQLNVAQPALSVQIRQLEEEIGAPLFDRIGRGVTLTAAGEVFLVYARQALRETKAGMDRARQAASGDIGRLDIGYGTAAGFLVFPAVIPPFRLAHPGVKLNFHSLQVSQQLEALKAGEIDIGFAYLPFATDGLDVEVLTREDLVAVVPVTHALARERSITVKDLSGETLVLPNRNVMPQLRQLIINLFDLNGATIGSVYESEHAINLLNFVGIGLGCGLLPSYVLQIKHDTVVYKPIDPPNLNLELVVMKRRDGRAQADRLFQAAVREFRDEDGHFKPGR